MTGPIVLEGPDGAGKTTLAKQLCDALGYAYVHEGPPPPVEDLAGYYIDRLAPSTVFDRLALSELVYGPLLRGSSRIDWINFERFQDAVRDLGGVTVICLPPLDFCMEAWRTNLQDELVQAEPTMKAVYEKFARLAKTLNPPTYDWTSDTPVALIKRLKVRR